jgi:hypothetical protein
MKRKPQTLVHFTALVLTLFVAGCAGPRTDSAPPDGKAGATAIVLSSGWQLQDIVKAPEAGATVSQAAFSPSGWFKATVPGTVLTSLVNDGVYPEPLYGENNRPDQIPESLCRTSYWYRTTVAVPSDYAARRIWLNFAGINYTAEVWVNGHNAGTIRGAFARGIFDVTSLVEPGKTAVVAVLIQPPPHPSTPLEQTQAAGTGGNGGLFSKDGPTFICTQGWDWIPGIRDRDMGIWQKVTLSASGAVVVENPLVYSTVPLPRTDSADLSIETTVRNVSDAPQTGVLHGAYEGGNFEVPVTLAPRESRLVKLTSATTPQLHIANPRLWWPNGYGAPNLYLLHLRFDLAGAATSDARDVSFGIRQITYQLAGSENLALSVNGVPVMCRGGNWGMDEAMKRIPRERLEAQVRFHQLANCNMIRNWVGQSTGEDFYDLCDRYGIMVWDEFFEPNPSDSGRTKRDDGSEDVHDIPLYLANVREKVLRFRNHPSIVLWCGRNEGDPAPAPVAEGIKQIMAELEPSRMYHPNSNDGKGVRSGGPYSWRAPAAYYAFPATGARVEAFKTELGSVSIPTLEAVHAMMPAKDWDTINDDWAEHDLCRGAQGGRPFYPDMITQRYGAWKGLPEFVRKAQLANYEAYRAMFEGRYAKLFSPSTGVLTWMSNPSQPSFVWQFYSYDLEPLASLFAVRKASESLHVQMNQNDFHAVVINQTPVAAAGLSVRVRVFNLDASLKSDRTIPVTAAASAATDVGAIEFPAELSAAHFVKLELRDAAGRLVSDNFYWRAQPASPDDFKSLDTLPVAALDTAVARHDADGKCLLDVTLTNPTKTVALLAHIQLRRAKSNERVLPVYYSDNYVSLLPGESRTITVEAAAKALGGEPPLVVLDGWNVTTAARSFPAGGGASSAVNADAQVGAAR